MSGKEKEKELAVKLRKEGKSYREILTEVPVAKSTLSEWFKSVKLAKAQKQRITQLRIDARLRGIESKRNKRLKEVNDLISKGKEEVGKLSERELWLIGTALYWGEGSKQTVKSLSSGIMFGNSDYKMILVFLRWLKMLQVDESDIYFELYIHKDRKADTQKFKQWWAEVLNVPIEKLVRVYYKSGNRATRRSNVGDLYHGLLRIRVKTSTVLNRRVNGWIAGIVNQ